MAGISRLCDRLSSCSALSVCTCARPCSLRAKRRCAPALAQLSAKSSHVCDASRAPVQTASTVSPHSKLYVSYMIVIRRRCTGLDEFNGSAASQQSRRNDGCKTEGSVQMIKLANGFDGTSIYTCAQRDSAERLGPAGWILSDDSAGHRHVRCEQQLPRVATPLRVCYCSCVFAVFTCSTIAHARKHAQQCCQHAASRPSW